VEGWYRITMLKHGAKLIKTSENFHFHHQTFKKLPPIEPSRQNPEHKTQNSRPETI